MRRRLITGMVTLVLLLGLPVHAAVLVTFEATDVTMAPVSGPVAAGSWIDVDILLSVDGEEDVSLADIRGLQFEFGETSSSLLVEEFAWSVNPAYSLSDADLPMPYALTVLSASSPTLLNLTTTPVAVASMRVTVNDTGTLNVVGAPDATRDTGAYVNAGFTMPTDFILANGNLSGGTLGFTVEGSGNGSTPDDSDGDGTPDDDDAFPSNPDETSDNDADGVGDNADPDDDDDGTEDVDDDFPLDSTETTDSDDDGVGDNSDSFPLDPTETLDSDDDGTGNNADEDDDNDGVDDSADAFPLDPTETADTDGDGIGDNTDPDNTASTSGGICGFGMVGTFLALFGTLSTMSLYRRRPRRSRVC